MSGEASGGGYSPSELDKEKLDSLLKTAPEDFYAPVYVDLLPNQPNTENTRANLGDLFRAKFDLKLNDAVDRVWKLPPLILRNPTAEYIALLEEARELFRMGYFYSCVAMCGIVGEKLVKDLLRDSVLISLRAKVNRPSDEAFDQLERVDSSAIMRFLNKAGLLNDEAKRAADELIQLRNKYAHARGNAPEKDALEAIRHLHIIVDGTVSVLRDYEISNGKFVPKQPKVAE
jgi:hypothetical protein